jgi:hypothetical protein
MQEDGRKFDPILAEFQRALKVIKCMIIASMIINILNTFYICLLYCNQET